MQYSSCFISTPPLPPPKNVYFLEVNVYRQEHYAGGRGFTYFDQFIIPTLSDGDIAIAYCVKCLATDASLTADPGVVSSIPAWSYTLVEIDHKITYMVILFPSADSFKKGYCQLQAKVCARSTG